MSEKMAGMGWYPYANFYALNLSYKFDLPVEKIAGVISALSPNNKWERNVLDAESVCLEYLGGPEAKVCTYGLNKQKALSILNGTRIEDVLKGNKTYAFYRNILDPSDKKYVTIDFHAVNIYDLSLTKREIKDKEYKRIAEEYIKTANMLNLLPNQLQATTWVTWRNNREEWMKSDHLNSPLFNRL